MRMVRWVAVLALVASVGGASVACSSSKGDKSSAGEFQPTGAAVADAAGGGTPSQSSSAQSASDESASADAPSFAVDAASAPAAAVGREVVSTATMTVHADDIAAAKEQAAAAVAAAGGFVFAEQGQFGDHPSATLTLKVPPDQFRSVLTGLARVGSVERQDVTTDDVTAQVIDLDSRISSAEISVVRVRGFLDRATNVADIATLESELLRRETDLEQLRGQKRSLDGRIDLATIVLTVQPPVPVATPPSSESTELPGFLEGLAAGWRVFVSAVTVLLATLGALLPFVPVIAVGAVAVWWTRRRARTAQQPV